jgi:hypothetical protein
MLYTAHTSVFNDWKKRMEAYPIMWGHGNDALVPDQQDLCLYREGSMTWMGLRVNYQAKLTRPEADELIEHIAAKAVEEDVVLISDEEDSEHCYRVLLAVMIVNMHSGKHNLRYVGELK